MLLHVCKRLKARKRLSFSSSSHHSSSITTSVLQDRRRRTLDVKRDTAPQSTRTILPCTRSRFEVQHGRTNGPVGSGHTRRTRERQSAAQHFPPRQASQRSADKGQSPRARSTGAITDFVGTAPAHLQQGLSRTSGSLSHAQLSDANLYQVPDPGMHNLNFMNPPDVRSATAPPRMEFAPEWPSSGGYQQGPAKLVRQRTAWNQARLDREQQLKGGGASLRLPEGVAKLQHKLAANDKELTTSPAAVSRPHDQSAAFEHEFRERLGQSNASEHSADPELEVFRGSAGQSAALHTANARQRQLAPHGKPSQSAQPVAPPPPRTSHAAAQPADNFDTGAQNPPGLKAPASAAATPHDGCSNFIQNQQPSAAPPKVNNLLNNFTPAEPLSDLEAASAPCSSCQPAQHTPVNMSVHMPWETDTHRSLTVSLMPYERSQEQARFMRDNPAAVTTAPVDAPISATQVPRPLAEAPLLSPLECSSSSDSGPAIDPPAFDSSDAAWDAESTSLFDLTSLQASSAEASQGAADSRSLSATSAEATQGRSDTAEAPLSTSDAQQSSQRESNTVTSLTSAAPQVAVPSPVRASSAGPVLGSGTAQPGPSGAMQSPLGSYPAGGSYPASVSMAGGSLAGGAGPAAKAGVHGQGALPASTSPGLDVPLTQEQELSRPVKVLKRRARPRKTHPLVAGGSKGFSAWTSWEAAGIPLACNGSSRFLQSPGPAQHLLAQSGGQQRASETTSHNDQQPQQQQQQQDMQNGYASMPVVNHSDGTAASSTQPGPADDTGILQEPSADMIMDQCDLQQQQLQQQHAGQQAHDVSNMRDEGNLAVLEAGNAGPQHAVNGRERSSHHQHNQSSQQHQPPAADGAMSRQGHSQQSIWEGAGSPVTTDPLPLFIQHDPALFNNSSQNGHSPQGFGHQNGHHLQQPLSYDISSDLSDGGSVVAEPDGTPARLADVHMVTSRDEAARVAQLIRDQYRDRWFAVDTEVADIDVKKESPCGHGRVTSLSVYCGDDANFALPGEPSKRQLWVDTLGVNDEGEGLAVMEEFRVFLEDPSIRKIWHNYSFDRHVLANHGIVPRGFGADTIHMARLLDSSRRGTKSYSLESLTGDYFRGDAGMEQRSKTSMKELFGKGALKKDGTEGKVKKLPPIDEVQRDPEQREKFIDYSAFDAKATFKLYEVLRDQLQERVCKVNPPVAEACKMQPGWTMWDLYQKFWQPFGGLLVDMERAGMLVDRDHLAAAQIQAEADQEEARKFFQRWAATRVPAAKHMNVTSTAQIQQLLFAGVCNAKGNTKLAHVRAFKADNLDGIIEEGKKAAKKHIEFELHGVWGPEKDSPLQPEQVTPTGWPAVSVPVLRSLAGKAGAARKALAELPDSSISSMDDLGSLDLDVDVNDPIEVVPPPAAAVKLKISSKQVEALEAEAEQKGFGKLYAAFGGGKEGLEACAAVDALCNVGAIDTLLSNFILPLQGSEVSTRDVNGNLNRIHCSLNINTETGRLSARRPNLQNQPAMEKDRYKVRKAFTADTARGNTLIVADYSQLELRLLAHIADCKSMQTAFKLGGDFHSRTALGMYDHIKEAIDQGKCLLEWEDPNSKPPVPLLKDMFASERRKAKVLNFSIAYGKTAHGLAQDFKTSLDEAKATVERWYADRPEVLKWQQLQRHNATMHGFVNTLIGRQRQLPDAQLSNNKAKGHALRAAINTPIQGSAADVATAAMLAIGRHQRLRELGWTLLLQVHDEVILEGPEESAEEAQKIVVDCMENPFDGKHNVLKVALEVSSNVADTWYEAK
ncbi:hypothetical protein WJX74_001704 [Apatococcus lobatus]|uniref:DNA-directed DNA polymerase n=1 Tax=Apatococcus lobatus TaxID=904363 RepID=A0AAW1Q9I0_9CHLO